MPGPEFVSQVVFSRKLPLNVEESLPEVARATPSPRDSARYLAGRGNGSSVRAHASAMQRIASAKSSRAGNYLLQLQRSYGNGYVQTMLSAASQSGASQVESIPAAGLELSAETPVLKQLSRAMSVSKPLRPKLTMGDPDDLYEKEAEEVAEKVMVQRNWASGGDLDEECEQCRMNRLSLQRVCTDETAGPEAPGIVDEVVTSPGRPLDEAARQTPEPGFGCDFSQIHELTHTNQQTGKMRRTVQRVSWDDVANVVSSAEDTVKQEAETAASAVASGAQAVGQAVESGAQAVAGAVETGAQVVAQDVEAAGHAVVSGAEAVASGAVAAGKAVVSGVEAAGQAVVGGTEETLAGLGGANAIAGLFGGKVTVTPSGGIVISIPDQEIAEVEDETFVLPFGIPTLTLFDAGFKLGPFVIDAWAGTIVGDPSVTLAIGPVRLQNISLVLDPVGGTYLGTAQLYIGSAISGSVEKADEAKLQAEGVIPTEPPIPMLASAEMGLRAILRLVGKEGFSDTVNVGYAGGSFILRQVFDVKLGALANLDHEAFLRVEIEGEEICSVIWPIKSQRLGDAGVEIRVPVTIATGSGKAVAIGTPTAAKFPADAIETDLQDDHEPEHCMGLEELAKFLCDKRKVPPDICAILLPGKSPGVGPTTPPVVPPGVLPPGPVTPPVGPVPPGPLGGGACPTPPPLPVILLLPALKGGDLDLYAAWLERGPLQHQVGRPRDTGQLRRWRSLMPGRVPDPVKQRGQSLGLAFDDVILPYWSKDSVLNQKMQVDHIVEMQVAPIGREGELDNMANYRLMEAEQNASVGPELAWNIQKKRDALTAEGGPAWQTCDLTFDRVSALGAAPPTIWTKEDIQSGKQLDAFERLGKPSKP